MAEPRQTHGSLQVRVDYVFDRLHDSKLAQAYSLLVPVRERPSARAILSNVQLVKYVNGLPPCHAQIEDLQALGFEIVDSPKFERAVRFRGELLVEGCMEALV